MIEAIPGKVDPLLLPFIIQNDKFFDYAVSRSAGGLSPRVKWEHLKDYEFDLPPIEEQRILADKLWAAYRLKESYKKLLTATQEMVKSQFIEMFGDTHMRSDHSRQWKEVVEIINGKDYKSIQVEDGGYPVYGTGGEMARASDYLSPANSILLGRKGTIDKPLLIREKYWNVDTAFGAVPDEKVLHYVYFYWHCKTIDFNVLNKGTTLPSTTKVDLLNLWIKIPSMEEQTRFGSIVEQADKSEFVGCKSQFFEMFEGDEYPLIKLGDYTDLTWGDTNTTKNSYVTEGYLAYSASGPDGKLDHYDYDCEGIVLSAIGADCGKTWFASGKWSCIKNTIRFWSTFDDLDNRFLYFATREKDFWPRRGGAQPFIPQGDARNCSIPLPPICLQRKFVEIAEQTDKSEYYN